MRVDKHAKQSGFDLSEFAYVVEANFFPTLANEFFIHIDCKHNSADREMEPEIVYHTSFHELDGKTDEWTLGLDLCLWTDPHSLPNLYN